jgi:HAD superfamily hydrolase (TIGR01549 family)
MTITTILLDLDDTLLDSNTPAFVAAYIKKLDQALRHFLPVPDDFMRVLRSAMAHMQANNDPTVTNHQAFYDTFLSYFNGDRAKVLVAIDQFYRESYPTLRSLVQPRPEAAPLVETLFKNGYRVIIATNPVFPRTAVEQRLAWAGVLDYPYELVTWLENMHFSKPAAAYYDEIFDRIKTTPQETLMVGDDPVNDIAPARSLGLPTWWITDLADPHNEIETTYKGTLAEFHIWIRPRPAFAPSA